MKCGIRKVLIEGLLALALAGSAALAAAAGTVIHLSGTLSVQRADGSTRILSQRSEVYPGDVLTTQRDSYAQIHFPDGSSLTLRPNTQIKLERFHFVQEQPQDDSTLLRLVKGSMRTVTGLVGKRGNPDAYLIQTGTASIGIRGSSGDTIDTASGGCEGAAPGCEKLPAGVYHRTLTGSYIMRNEGGSQMVNEGQFGFARDLQTSPTLLPRDPGLNLAPLPFAAGVKGGAQSAVEDCVVR